MSSLNDLIKRWKEGMSKEESLQSDDLTELEQHLHTSAVELRNSGLNDEEAFLIASSRLGDSTALEREFRKVNGSLVWQRRIFWMLAGYVGLFVFGKLISGAGSVAAAVAAYAGAGGIVMASASLLVLVLGWVCLLFAAIRLARRGEGRFMRHVQKTSSVVLAVGLIGCLLAGTIMSLVGPVISNKVATVEIFGEAMNVMAIGNLVLQIAIPTACVMVMVTQRRERRSLA